MISQLFSIIAPVAIGVLLGFVWGRKNLPYDSNFVSTLVFNLGVPFLVFSTLTAIEVDLGAFAEMVLAIVLALIAFLAISYVILRLAKLDLRTYWATVTMPNTGNVGLPLCFLAFGDQGLVFAIIVYSVVATAQFTLGLSIAAGSISPRSFLKVPLVYALLVALPFLITGVHPPAWAANSTKLIGQMAIPLMLITLGVSLAKLRVTAFPRALALSILRLVMGFGVGLGLATLFGMEGAARGVLILQCSMPVAIFNYMLALQFKNSPEQVAGVIVTSTLISFAVMPFLLTFVL